ncbi:XdhC family protein [Novosphingobium sp.]|uniref:XdhC family protein n=1 Tax=Novosphingobium sp. TaxID=1874826 RepID=UPI003341A16C
MIAARPIDALRLIERGEREGVPGVLVTLTGIEGSSSRAIGTQMAVLADGRQVGSFSGGCVERAIAAEALDVLAQGQPRMVRYGVGSPYFDVRLPCGGGIDLLFTPRPDAALVAEVITRVDQRVAAQLQLGDHEQTYLPGLRMVALGHGEDLLALVRLARAYGIEVIAHAPRVGDGASRSGDGAPRSGDGATTSDLSDEGIRPLLSPRQLPMLATDAWTAIVFVFHDRDWEEFLLPQALALPAFYHGAVGSRRTHQTRIDRLHDARVPSWQIDRLRGSIGLIPGTRNPATLALSILAEVVQDYDACAATMAWQPGVTTSA